MTSLYMIVEPHRTGSLQPMDGEFMPRELMLRNLKHADEFARVFAFDLSEAMRDGSTSMRDVTEDVVRDACASGDLDEDYGDRIVNRKRWVDFKGRHGSRFASVGSV